MFVGESAVDQKISLASAPLLYIVRRQYTKRPVPLGMGLFIKYQRIASL
jgi:hypothetical protein